MRKQPRQAVVGTQSQIVTVDFPTSDPDGNPQVPAVPRYWCLTLLYHPDPARIGAQFRWPTEPGIEVSVNRLKPEFTSADGALLRPLESAYISRSPLLLKNTKQGVLLRAVDRGTAFTINGRPGVSDESIPARFISRGVILGLGSAVCFMLHPSSGPVRPGAYPELVGVSDELERVRQQIDQLRRVELPLLITGESGSGKELIARAIHQSGPRSGKPLLAVNMAALPPTMAAVELFGHARGVYTGATEARPGLIRQADGGTLLLDEIGEASTEIQTLLLRVLESGEIQPMGLAPVRTNVHIIAATDANLLSLTRTGAFRPALLHRLSVTSLRAPALRERLIDVPLLFVRFLRQALARFDAQHRLEPGARAWLHRRDILALLRYSWPGNVRELRNIAHHTAAHSHGLPHAALPVWLLKGLLEFAPSDGSTPTGDDELSAWPRLTAGLERTGQQRPGLEQNAVGMPWLAAPSSSRRDEAGSTEIVSSQMAMPVARPSQLTEETLSRALEANGWCIRSTAENLGISKKSLYSLMDRYGIRTAGSLSDDEIRLAIGEENSVNVAQLAARLKVSKRGLKIRMSAGPFAIGTVPPPPSPRLTAASTPIMTPS